MSDVNFGDETQMTAPPRSQEAKGFYKLVVSLGLAKDAEGARMILIVIAVLAIIAAIAYPFIFG